MASDTVLRLSRLLLQQSDRQPIRTVNGHDLVGIPAGLVRQFMRLGCLVQNEDIGDADGWVLHRDEDRIVAVESRLGGDHRDHDALAVETYNVDFQEICRAIRRNSILEGPEVSIVGTKSVYLGAIGKGPRRHEYYIVRALPTSQAQEVLLAVRAHATPGCLVTILLPTQRDLPNDLLRRLAAEKVSIAFVSDQLVAGSTEPFTIELATSGAATGADELPRRLSVDIEGRVAMFDGVELKVAPREFAVLIELANEATDLGGFVSRDRISTAIRSASGKDESFEEQVDKAINRLRDAFRKDRRITAEDRASLIKTKPKVGYRLALLVSDIQVI